MTHRRGPRGKAFGLGAAALVMAGVVPLSAEARPSFAIKECAQASTLRATIDPKKKDAARKTREVNRLMEICRQKVAAERAQGPAPIKKAIVRSAVQHPPPPPRTSQAPARPVPPRLRPAQPPMRPAGPPNNQAGGNNKAITLGDLFSALRRRRQPPAPAPAPAAPPQPAMAPRPAPAPAAAPAPAMVPVAYSPPVPQPATSEQRNVFGIQLGEPLNLPACAAGVVNAKDPKAFESTSKVKTRAVTASCAQKGAAVQALGQRMADAEGKPIPNGVEFALVRLAADRCPAWVSGGCTLSVALKSGVALGVSFLTIEDAEREVGRQLASKYDTRPVREAAACDAPASPGAEARRRMGADSSWKLADLSVSYWSVNGLNCGQGRVMVKTSSLEELFEQAMSGDDQPKM